MNLGELRRFVNDNSEPGQHLKFYDNTPGYLEADQWFVDPDRLYQINVAKPKMFKREAAICLQEDLRDGHEITRELFLDFIDSLCRTSFTNDTQTSLVLFNGPVASLEPCAGRKYLTGMWAKIEIEVVKPGEFALSHGVDTEPFLKNLAEAFTEGSFR